MAKRKSSIKNSKPEKSVKKDENGEGSEDDQEYEVEKIIHHRKFSNGSVEYLIRWKGFGPDDDTWENEGNLASSVEIIEEYKKTIKDMDDSDAEVDTATNGKEDKEEEDRAEPTSEEEVNSEDEAKKKKKKKTKKSTPSKKSKEAAKGKKGGRGRPAGKAKGKGKPAKKDEDESGEESTAEYEVERIIDVHSGKKGQKEYLVRWKGYSAKDDTWEPEAHLTCPDLIEAFNAKLEKIKSVSQKSLRAAPKKTKRLTVEYTVPSGRHSKRNAGKRKSYAEEHED